MRGTFPASSVFNTISALLVQVAVISLRYLKLAAPAFFCSGMATAMLPASSTTCPMASRRASRPATRTAEGPMSTPAPGLAEVERNANHADVARGDAAVSRAALGHRTSSQFQVLSSQLTPVRIVLLRTENRELKTETTGRADAAYAGRESSRARAPIRRPRLRLAQCPCRSRSGGRCRICGDRDTT